MSQFTTHFIGKLIGKNLWEVYEEFEYHVGCYPSEEVIKVPVGFKTDFASVPRLLWMIISPIDDHGKAAVVHDYCYYVAYDTKKRCDDIFREGLIVLRVPKWKVVCMYWSVRIFGWVGWLKHRIKRG